MRQIHIVNPAAGNHKAETFLPDFPVEVYRSQAIGDIERFVAEHCENEPDTHFIAYGGDGTLNEVINGIMQANAQDRAKVSCVPVGTGNDFVRNFSEDQAPMQVDVLRYNDRYSINMLNIGFDCDVVARTAKLKNLPLVAGPFAYILGVVATLCRPIGHRFNIDAITEHDEHIQITEDVLLVAAGNGCFCGGGFYSMPFAKQDNGLFELLIIKKISRFRFLKLVGDYKAGTYFDSKTGEIAPEFREFITRYRVKQATIHNMEQICADGEVAPMTDAIITVLPRAICYVPNPEFDRLQDIQEETKEENTPAEPASV